MSRVWSRRLCQWGLVAASLLGASTAVADCTSPAAVEGALDYNTSSQLYQFCNGTTWVTWASGSGGYADHIISGTTAVWVNSATATISFTTNGSVANYFDNQGRLVTTGISVTTNQMSATTGYFSGKVGIGTASPGTRLYASGGDGAGWVGTFTADSGSSGVLIGKRGGIAAIGTTGQLNITLAPDGGKVGIGTTNPSQLLTVGDGTGVKYIGINGADNGTTVGAALVILNSGTMVGAIGNGSAINGGSYDANFRLYTPNQIQFSAGAAASPQVVISTAGNVGIGITAPAVRLDVSGEIIVSNTGLACSAAVTGGMRYQSTSDTLQICTGSGWKSLTSNTAGGGTVTGTGTATAVAYWSGASGLTYDSDGFYWDETNNRLGIGTNTPGYSLTISRTLTPVETINFGTSSSYGQIQFQENGVLGGFIDLLGSAYPTGNNVTRALRIGTWQNGPLVIYTSQSERVRVDASGNMGIGTITPTATLQVSGTFTVSNSAQVTTPSLFVASNGNVGIGTTTPTAPLGVAGYIVAMNNTGVDTTIGDGTIYTDRSSLYLQYARTGPIRMMSGTTQVMTVGPSNNVGVSNSNPMAKLDVNGTISASDAIQLGSSSLTCASSIAGALRYSTGNVQYCNGSSWSTMTSGTSTVTGSGSAGQIAYWSGASALTGSNTLFFDTTLGRVGIGNITPGAKLDVVYDAASSGFRVINAAGTVYTLFAGSNSNDINGFGAPLRLYSDTGGLVFRVNGADPAMTIVSGTGNVGIGTTSPDASLTVTRNGAGFGTNGTLNLTNTSMHTDASQASGAQLNFQYGPANTTYQSAIRGTSQAPGVNGGVLQFLTDDTSGNLQTRVTILPDGNVGIGTTGPGHPLHVSGSIFAGSQVYSSGTTAGYAFYDRTVGTGLGALYRTAGATHLWDSVAGDVITYGTSGGIRFHAYGAGTLTTDGSGNITAASDERLKDIEGEFTRGLADLTNINPILYRWNKTSGLDPSATYAGFSAQNVQKQIPEAIGRDAKGFLSLSDRPLMATMVNAIKELKAANDNVVSETAALRVQLKVANDNIEDLRHELRDLKNGVGFKRAVGQ